MLKHIFLITACFLFLNSNVSAQENLIPNPSFEQLIDCNGANQGFLVGKADYWYSAVKTPDVYNKCFDKEITGVPVNWSHCYQEARTGFGYAGLRTFYNPRLFNRN